MTKEKYMALSDIQEIWTNKQKPFITQNYATKAELEAASTATMFQLYVDPTDMHLKGKPTGYGTFEVVNGHLILHQTE